MQAPAAIFKSAEIAKGVSAVAREFSPDVVRIRYNADSDWSGDAAVYFRVLLADEVAEKRLHEVATKVRKRIESKLKLEDRGFLTYTSFRTVTEQAELQEECWD